MHVLVINEISFEFYLRGERTEKEISKNFRGNLSEVRRRRGAEGWMRIATTREFEITDRGEREIGCMAIVSGRTAKPRYIL